MKADRKGSAFLFEWAQETKCDNLKKLDKNLKINVLQ